MIAKHKNSIILLVLAVVAAIASLAFTYYRLYYGVDFTDEAFYTGIPYEFALGMRPFIDEMNFLTFPSLLLFPFVKLFHLVTGGTEGIILYNRHLFLGFFLLVAVVLFFILKRVISVHSAILSSAIVIAFIPLNIPALGYNTLSCGFLTLGLFITYHALSHRERPLYFALSGLLIGLSVVSYPTLVIPFVLYVLLLFLYLVRLSKLRAWFLFIAGSFIAASPVLIMMAVAGVDHVLYFIENLGYVGKQGGGIEKIADHISLWFTSYHYKWGTILVLAAAALLFKKYNAVSLAALMLLPVFSYPFHSEEPVAFRSLIWVTNYSMLLPFFYFIHRRDETVRKMVVLIFLPSFFAGVTYLWSSSNGYIAAGLGFFPAFIAMTVLLLHSVEKTKVKQLFKHVAIFSAPVFIMASLIWLQQQSVYRDQPIHQLTQKVEDGPYKGLYTSEEKMTFMKTLSKDLDTFSKKGETIFYYNHFPAGYLFSDRKPAGNTIWIFYYSINREIHSDYLAENGLPDTVIRMKYLVDAGLTPMRYYKSDDLNNLVKKEYDVVHENAYYEIFKRKP
ncbi:hypothetical protein ACFQPF_06780 [Fictibacillus iocasae]|uniref:Glycosyltransferase RgtA/B/C/D-like domain-containing protein n=1 Tax=Fictibacillus iocasae TaxID=2715437 RepID=A0ABW2NLN6_9BACL